MALIRYMLEVEEDGRFVRAVGLPYVAHIDGNLQLETERTWTWGKLPVEERAPVSERPFTLRGRSGLAERTGHDRYGHDMSAPGPELFREVKAFIANYQNEAAERDGFAGNAASLRSEYRMILRALDEDLHVYVTPERMSWARDVATSRFSYEWTLTGTAYAEAARRRPPATIELHNMIEALRSSEGSPYRKTAAPSAAPDADDVPDAGFGERARSALVDSAVARGVMTAFGSVSEVIGYASWAFDQVDEILDGADQWLRTFEQPLRAVQEAAADLREVAQGIRDVVNWPRRLVRMVKDTAKASVVAAMETWEALPLTDREKAREAMFTAVGFLDEVGARGEAALGEHYIRTAQAGLTSSPSAAEYTMQEGETLRSLSLRLYGDPERWQAIAALNGMSSPTHMPNGEPLGASTRLLLPVERRAVSETLDAGAAFGATLAVSDDGDLVKSAADDVALVAGWDCLAQDLRHRLITTQGQALLWVGYGLPVGVGQVPTATRIGMAAAHSREQLLADARIERVERVDVIDGGDRLRIHSDALAVGGKVLPITHGMR